MPTPNRRRVTDIDALRTLAHPIRYQILGHLMAVGPQTASQCAEGSAHGEGYRRGRGG